MIYTKFSKFLETVDPRKMTNDKDSFFSVYLGQRNICFLGRNYPFYLKLANEKNLGVIEIKKNDINNPYSLIIYNKNYEKNAKELEQIALKYNGYLSHDATAYDSYRIGILLEYDEDEVKKYLKKKYPKSEWLKFFESLDDNNQLNLDPKLKLQVTKYVEEQLGSQNFHEIFDIIGIDMPQTLEGDEFEEKMDLAKEKAIEFYMKNPERMRISEPKEFKTFNIGKDSPIPSINNIGGVFTRR